MLMGTKRIRRIGDGDERVKSSLASSIRTLFFPPGVRLASLSRPWLWSKASLEPFCRQLQSQKDRGSADPGVGEATAGYHASNLFQQEAMICKSCLF